MVRPISSDEVTAATVSDPGGAGAADDWLGDEAEIEWFPEDAETAVGGAAERRARRRDGSRGWVGDAVASAAGLDRVYRRRRAVGIVAVVVLAGAVVVAGLVLSGGNSSTKLQAPPVTTGAASTSTVPGTTATTPITHSSSPAGATLRVVLPVPGEMRQGDTGSAVKTLQRALAKLGSSPGKADGIFGPLTEQAVVAYQQANGLATDGIVGPKTAAKINAALAAAGA